MSDLARSVSRARTSHHDSICGAHLFSGCYRQSFADRQMPQIEARRMREDRYPPLSRKGQNELGSTLTARWHFTPIDAMPYSHPVLPLTLTLPHAKRPLRTA